VIITISLTFSIKFFEQRISRINSIVIIRFELDSTLVKEIRNGLRIYTNMFILHVKNLITCWLSHMDLLFHPYQHICTWLLAWNESWRLFSIFLVNKLSFTWTSRVLEPLRLYFCHIPNSENILVYWVIFQNI